MNFYSKRPHRFSPNEVELVHSIANHVGIAIENSHLYEETKKQAVELKQSIRETEATKRELEFDIAQRKRAEEALQARYREIQILHEISQSVLSLIVPAFIAHGVIPRSQPPQRVRVLACSRLSEATGTLRVSRAQP